MKNDISADKRFSDWLHEEATMIEQNKLSAYTTNILVDITAITCKMQSFCLTALIK